MVGIATLPRGIGRQQARKDRGSAMDTTATTQWLGTRRRRIYLMRHGEVDYFDALGKPFKLDTVGLNAEGRMQAQDAARDLAKVPLDRVVASCLARSVETAQLVVYQRNLIVENRDDLREIEPGRLADLTKKTPDEIERMFLGALAADLGPATRFLDGETFAAVRCRVQRCYLELLAEPKWTQMLVVAHGVVNRMVLADVLGLPYSGLGALEQDAGCINVIDVDDAGHGLVRLLNYTPANPVKSGMELTTLERLYLQFCQRCPKPSA
jgi:probable phosphoglycerate mutase